MVWHHCGVQGHKVNECPKLTQAQRKQLWDDGNKDHREKSNTAMKEVIDNTSVSDVAAVVPAEDDAARIKYER